jgi:predicted molibdopterin-dependent oxidoreductase YjgC
LLDFHCERTVCPYCGAGCHLLLEVLDGKLVGTLPCKEDPVSDGKLCAKGWNAWRYVEHPERLRTPLLRRGSVLEPVTWQEALEFLAAKLWGIREEHGPQAIGFFASAKCTNEENYLIQKLARAVMGTNNVDHCARL